ncbi:hypothetical protein OGAPHI_001601 [Ogataea philodendri]|uniref:Sister chromatid cohesion protein PDS5 n=1 Tax=Ogataea philodendri TaxID=1378263 RepID=A0A9P8PD39_9ASCO|nr:uncharacterized protein OGAPHI_001601 [Ogataea philodendri]KAH3669480.1 hypothetical protein OGAPHI_001601 [Ogataea philodendri]
MAISKGLETLKFNDALVGTVNKPIPTKDLVLRLQQLQNELSSLDQDKVDLKSLDKIKDSLINKKLVKHSNSGVQAYCACCLADVLRFYAPDAPYNASQLSDLFGLFYSQFKQLNNQDGPYYHQQTYLLTRLAETRSVVLITDLPNSEALVEQIFDIFYNLASSGTFNSRLEPLACEILSEVIAESSTIPTKTLKLILNKFLANTMVLKKGSTSIPGFKFTLEICNSNADRMSRLLTQLFSETIYEATRGKENEDYDEDKSDINKLLEQLKKLHTLAIELWKYVPEMLSSVMGLIDNELDAEEEKIRITATETIGKMLAIPNSRLNFASAHNDTYMNWLKKPLDKSPHVRSFWVKSAIQVISKKPSIASELSGGLVKTLVDSDERTRLTTVRELSNINPSVFISKVANKTIMNTLGQLVREKHSEIRSSCLQLLGNIYDSNFDLLYKGDPTLDQLVGWIPDDVLKLVYINDKTVNAQVDYTLFELILPFEEDHYKRVTRLLTVVDHLSEKGRSSFYAIVKRQQQLSKAVNQLLTLAEMKQTEEVSSKFEKLINWLVASFPETVDCRAALRQLVKLNNKRYFKLIRVCADMKSDYKTVSSSTKELFNKVSELKNIKIEDEQSVSPHDMLFTVKLLVYRSSVIFYNQNNIGHILKATKDSSNQNNKIAQDILENISTVVPEVLSANISTLVQALLHGEDIGVKDMKAIYQFGKKFPDLLNPGDDEEYIESLKKIAMNGSPSEAKYAVRLLGQVPRSVTREVVVSEIMDEIWPLDLAKANLNTSLATISELFLTDYNVLEDKTKELSSVLASQILLMNQTVGKEDEEDANGWIADNELQNNKDCHSKLLAIQIFVNWLIAVEEAENAAKVAEPVFKLLKSIIGNGGEIVSVKSETYPTPKQYQSRLRLEAGTKLLKLSRYPKYNFLIEQEMVNRLILLIQDENENVRAQFMAKLKKSLTLGLISDRFYPLVFFIAHEPNASLREDTKTWVRSMFKRKLKTNKNELLFEKSFVRMLNILSHHQEFLELLESSKQDSNYIPVLNFALTYISLALDLISNANNISLLYYLASRMKQYRDRQTPELSPNMYLVSDLTQFTIKSLCKHKSWSLATWPGKLTLPSDLYQSIGDSEQLHELSVKSFIPESETKALTDLVRDRIKHLSGSSPQAAAVAVERKRQLEEEEKPKSKKPLIKAEPQRRSSIQRATVNYKEDEDEEYVQ